ncbi:MAG TPA: hypothetical protein VFI46_10665 [Jiangellaceae bacterium]|nr:hypothetical protein [Jiangellaceae bacterium]
MDDGLSATVAPGDVDDDVGEHLAFPPGEHGRLDQRDTGCFVRACTPAGLGHDVGQQRQPGPHPVGHVASAGDRDAHFGATDAATSAMAYRTRKPEPSRVRCTA